jgi:hypothetical protein
MPTPADTATLKANQFFVAGEKLEEEDDDSLSPNADASPLQSTFNGAGEGRDGVETPLSEDGRVSVSCALSFSFWRFSSTGMMNSLRLRLHRHVSILVSGLSPSEPILRPIVDALVHIQPGPINTQCRLPI